MNAIVFLTKQHRETEELFSKLEAEDADKGMLLHELGRKLSGHMEIEEEIFYPAVYEVDSDEIHHAIEEHEEAKIILDKIMDMAPDDSQFASTLSELKEKVLHHVKEEERDLFPKVRKEMPADELEDLYLDMKDLLDELEEQQLDEKSA